MPVNYYSFKPYLINYDELYNELMKNNFIINDEEKRTYIKNWIKKLRYQDQKEVELFNNDVNYTSLLLKEDFEAPEKYMLEIEYKTQKISIFLKISRIWQRIKTMNNMIVHHISVDDFINSNSHIRWHRTDSAAELSQAPILLAQLRLGDNIEYVVIDGNHRLTAWINDVENIPCYILDRKWLIDNEMFYTDFSKLMYIFQNEIGYLVCTKIESLQTL